MMPIEISLEGIDEPRDYPLVGGPFDGSSIRIGVDIQEYPPMRVSFEWFPNSSRGDKREQYVLADIEGDFAYRHESVRLA